MQSLGQSRHSLEKLSESLCLTVRADFAHSPLHVWVEDSGDVINFSLDDAGNYSCRISWTNGDLPLEYFKAIADAVLAYMQGYLLEYHAAMTAEKEEPLKYQRLDSPIKEV